MSEMIPRLRHLRFLRQTRQRKAAFAAPRRQYLFIGDTYVIQRLLHDGDPVFSCLHS